MHSNHRFLARVAVVFCLFLGLLIRPVVGHDYVPGQLVIKVASGSAIRSASQDQLFSQFGATTVRQLPSEPVIRSQSIQAQSGAEQLYLVDFDPSANMIQMAQELAAHPDVVYAEPNYYVTLFETPNDPEYSRQSYIQQSALNPVFSISQTQEIIVAVVDTGVDYNNPDFASTYLVNLNEDLNGIDDDGNGYVDDIYGYDFYGYSLGIRDPDPADQHGHGTHVAGIIGAQTNNALGVSGIATNVKILGVSFLDASGRGTQVDAAMAIRYAVDRGARVINCSWGYYHYNSVLASAIQYAASSGVIIVAASGNSDSDIVEYPAGFNHVIAVGSVNLQGSPSWFTSFGPHLEFVTYGESLYNLGLSNGYSVKSGTSQSSAVVSGVVAAMLSNQPGFDLADVREALQLSTGNTARQNDTIGYGVINAGLLSSYLSSLGDGPTSQPITTASTLGVDRVLNFPNPFGLNSGTQFGFELSRVADVEITVYDIAGRQVKKLNELKSAGYQTISWNGLDDQNVALANGTYFYVLKAVSGNETMLKKGRLAVLKNL